MVVSNLLPDCSDILATHLYRKQALKIHFKQMGINVYTTAHIQDPIQMKSSAGVKPWVQIVHTLANNWKTFSFPL
jgi:hypothetical protein